jgi:uncharacterized protein (DUF2384 family)
MKITKQNTSNINDGTAFRLANNILQKWGCSANEKQAILGLTHTSYHRFQKDNYSAKLSSEQLERISYLANIHESLRMIFSNEENVYGFMRMKNDNHYFNGRSPISVILNCSIDTLHEVFKRIDTMRQL